MSGEKIILELTEEERQNLEFVVRNSKDLGVEMNKRSRELAARIRGLVDSPPQVLKAPDWSKVIKLAEARRDSVADGTHHEDDDNPHYMFEEAMKAVFGSDYFDWENART